MFQYSFSEEFIPPIFGPKSSGVSETNQTIEDEFREVIEHLEETEPYWLKIRNIQQFCDEIYNYTNDNWDGYGANAIKINSFIEAIKFFFFLPNHIDLPELIPLPSGEVAFEWYSSEHKQFTVTFTGENVLIFAGIYGPYDKRHGTCFFDEDIAKELMTDIIKVYN